MWLTAGCRQATATGPPARRTAGSRSSALRCHTVTFNVADPLSGVDASTLTASVEHDGSYQPLDAVAYEFAHPMQTSHPVRQHGISNSSCRVPRVCGVWGSESKIHGVEGLLPEQRSDPISAS